MLKDVSFVNLSCLNWSACLLLQESFIVAIEGEENFLMTGACFDGDLNLKVGMVCLYVVFWNVMKVVVVIEHCPFVARILSDWDNRFRFGVKCLLPVGMVEQVC